MSKKIPGDTYQPPDPSQRRQPKSSGHSYVAGWPGQSKGGSQRQEGSQPSNASGFATDSGHRGPHAKGGSSRDGAMTPEEFERLCRQVEETVGGVAKAVGQGLGNAGGVVGSAISSAVVGFQQAQREKQARMKQEQEAKERLMRIRQRFQSSSGTMATGVLLAVAGAFCAVLFGGVAINDVVLGLESVAELVVLSACAAGGVATAAVGFSRIGRARRLNAFERIIGDRDMCTFQELSHQMNLSDAKTVEVTRKLLSSGLLPQGHIDDSETCVILTHDAYRRYREAQDAYNQQEGQRRAEEAARRRARATRGTTELDQDALAFIEEGEDYVRQLKDLDVAIDDEAVSAKIVSIQEVLGRILERVREEPAVLDSLDRLTSYYLPTTIRLLAAYDSLEDQPVQVENVSSSRREIESTLDVLCDAYEKILDDTYQDFSMDVASDISVLHAVLAQDGLKESPFDKRGAGPDAVGNNQ